MHQKITPNLWFDTEAEEAAGFYTSVFDNSGSCTSPTTPRARRGRPAW